MTNPIVSINSVEIHPIVIRDQRVLTFTQVDEVHGRPKGTARRNFTENKSRLIEGQDWFSVSPDEIRTTSPGAISDAHRSKLTVVTESGYLLLVKSFTDDLAWQIQRELVNAYFRVNPERTVGERYETIIPSEQQTLSELAQRKVAHLAPALQGKGLAEIWSRLHNKFRIAKYSQLPRTQLADAIVYMASMELRGVPNADHAPRHPASEPLTNNDMANLRRVIWLISHRFHYEQAWTQGVWYALRDATGVRSPNRFTVDNLPVLTQEMRRILQAVEPLVQMRNEAELEVLRRVVRRREQAEPLIEDWRARLMRSAKEDHGEIAHTLSGWMERDLEELAARAQAGRDYPEVDEPTGQRRH
ncbi:toxin Bro [Marichromatium purpuratum 984]|uniref:Toxin Bro n=1 Tax=Marichromatium purpuratum 984 TaxID=765910 RepID=W0E2V7_MARPU|nr:ORF6N domain-containing protein [Marichromatium purpuratum]AHF03431.1 toxin Bro [Marichromatium purpuratum 984]